MPFLTLLVGVLACSTSIIWIKCSTVDPVLLTGLRLLIAAVVLSPLAWRDWRRHRGELTWRHLRDSAIPGLVLAVHFVTWIIGARLTLASNGSLIVNLTPLLTPFLLATLMGERVNRREIAATALALAGLSILFGSDYHANSEHLWGDLVCLGSMSLFALYLTLGRKFRHHPTNWLYVVPLYYSAALVALLATTLLSDPAPIDWRAEAPWVLALALLPTIVGHTLLNNAMRQLRGQVVSVVNMTQFIFAGTIAWVWLGETPSRSFYPAAALLLMAGLMVALPRRRRADPPGAD